MMYAYIYADEHSIRDFIVSEDYNYIKEIAISNILNSLRLKPDNLSVPPNSPAELVRLLKAINNKDVLSAIELWNVYSRVWKGIHTSYHKIDEIKFVDDNVKLS